MVIYKTKKNLYCCEYSNIIKFFIKVRELNFNLDFSCRNHILTIEITGGIYDQDSGIKLNPRARNVRETLEPESNCFSI